MKLVAAAITAAVTRRRQSRGERTVSVKAEQQSEDDGQTASAENVRTEYTVLRAKHKQSDKDPKGRIALIATSHIKPPVFAAGVCSRKKPCGLFFLLHHIPQTRLLCRKGGVFRKKRTHFS